MLDLFGSGHALMGQQVDGVCLPRLLVELLPGARDLLAQLIQMLLHRAQLGLGRTLWIPSNDGFDGAVHGRIGLNAN